MEEHYDLTTLAGLERAVLRRAKRYANEFAGTYCPECGDIRRMTLHDRSVEAEVKVENEVYWGYAPSLFTAHCLQCRERIVLLVHHGPLGNELVALPSSYGGVSTTHTPPAVAYYLDQAHRCQAVAALSAAVAMYRAGLEQLLHEQGYTERLLVQKIEALEQEKSTGAGEKSWLRDLDPAFLRVIKDLGNAAIHTNDGDIAKQEVIAEARLITEVRALFGELLREVYERQHEKSARLAFLKDAADVLGRQD